VASAWTGRLAGLADELRIFRHLATARLRAEMQYRVSFWLQVTGNFALYLSELAAILILLRHFDTLGGWRPGEVAFLYGLSSFSFGIANTAAAGFSVFSQQVVRGDFDRILTRPLAPMLQVLASDIQLRRLGGVLQGLAAFLLASRLIDLPWTPGRVVYLPVVILSASVLFMALFALEATLCFWTTEGTEVVNAFTYGGFQLALYPIHIFEIWLRRLFLFIIPLGFVIYAPALYLLDKSDPLGLPVLTRFLAPLAAVAFALVVGTAWQAGVRRYRSTGT